MTFDEIMKSRAALVAQCPVVTRPEGAERFPIHVTTWGDTGSPVLCVHGGVQGGIGGGPDNFAKQKPLIARGWQLSLVDRPGFGHSPSRGPDDQEADSEWIAQKLGDGSHLIGHSFGGTEALLAAAKRPGTVRSLVLIEPALQPMLVTDPESLQRPDIQAALQIVTKFFLTARTPAEFATSFATSLGQGEDGGDNPSSAALRAHPERAAMLGCALLQARTATPAAMRQAAETVARANIPVLVISGGYSAAYDATCKVVATLTHGRHEVVAAPNHFVQQSSPSQFNSVVDSFMRMAEEASKRVSAT